MADQIPTWEDSQPVAAISDKVPTWDQSLPIGTAPQVAGETLTKKYLKSVGRGAVKGATFQELTPEEQGTPGMKFGEFAGSIIPTTAVGALVPGGAAVSPMARAALSGMTYAASKGAVNQKPITDTLQSMAGNSLGFMAGEKGAQIAGKIFKPFAAAARPEIQESVKVAERAGIKPPLSNMTDSKFVQGAERMAEYSPFFGHRITQIREKALGGLKSFADKISSSIGPDRPPEVSGNLAKQRLLELPQVLDETRNKLYDAVMPILKDKPVGVDNTIKTLEDVIARRSGELEPAGLAKLKGLLTSLRSKEPNLATFEGGKDSAVTLYGQLKRERTNLGSMVKTWNDPASVGLQDDLKGVYAAMAKDLDTAASAVSSEVAEGIKAANAFNKQAMDTLKSKMYQAITGNSVKPENVYKVVIQPNSPSQIELGKELLGDNFKDIARQWWSDTIKPKNGSFVSPPDIVKKIDRYGSSIDAMFKDTPEVLSKIKDLRQIAELMTRGNKVTEGSQTAYLFSTFGQIMAAISAAFGGNLKTAGALAATIGLEGAASKGIESNIGRKYLTTGFPKAAAAVENTVRPMAQVGGANLSDLIRSALNK